MAKALTRRKYRLNTGKNGYAPWTTPLFRYLSTSDALRAVKWRISAGHFRLPNACRTLQTSKRRVIRRVNTPLVVSRRLVMSANSLHRWTTSQRLALALSVVSSALLGLVVSLTIIRSPYLCTEELRFKE